MPIAFLATMLEQVKEAQMQTYDAIVKWCTLNGNKTRFATPKVTTNIPVTAK